VQTYDDSCREAHPCPLPTARRGWHNRLYICDCGAAWYLVRWTNYAADGYEWKRWKP
jgi:hypothetical protein